MLGIPLKSHINCELCGSSDAATMYRSRSDPNFIYKKCYSCNEVIPIHSDTEDFTTPTRTMTNNPITPTETVLFDYEISEPFRGIEPEVWKEYQVSLDAEGTKLSFPLFDLKGNLVASKVKHLELDEKGKKVYRATGEYSKGSLFGVNVAVKKSGKTITVTEGEEDALACYQMFGGIFPVVSLKGGAAAAKSSLSEEDIEWLKGYNEIVICFDADNPGRKASEDFAKSFANSKVKISVVNLNPEYKDANGYLEAGRREEFVKAWWSKRSYTPEGLIYSGDTFDLISQGLPEPVAYFPWEGLNEVLWGIYSPQLITLTAGSGVGKTQVTKAILSHLFETTSEKIGLLFLEESVGDTVLQFLSGKLGLNLSKPEIRNSVSQDLIKESWKEMFADNRFMFWNHFGSNDIETVCNRIRYIAHNFGAKFIVLDHVSIVVSSGDNGDERKALDQIMTKMRTLCQELDITIFCISHLRRPNGSESHEEGGVTSLSQLRGSAGIAQLSDVVIGLERNGQHVDPFMRNVVTIRVLKSRRSGLTGPAAYVIWDNDKFRFTEIKGEEVQTYIERLRAEHSNLTDSIMDEMVS